MRKQNKEKRNVKIEIPEVQTIVHSALTFISMNAARSRGFGCVLNESWTSDAGEEGVALLFTETEVLWNDMRPQFEGHDVCVLMKGTVVALTRNRRDISVSVYANLAETCEIVMAIVHNLLPTAGRTDKMLDVTFWYYSEQQGPQSYDRQLQAPAWNEIASNYPRETQERLIALQNVELNDGTGKLVLWQGEPGTGKTFALRSLGEKWADWCRIHYVLDPEKFFANGDYLLRVILGSDTLPEVSPGVAQSGPVRPSWRLIVLEDSGELLAKDAKSQVGQGLSRLLNLSDGLLGQGLRVLVLITTNEEVKSIHAAVSRPGRCLSHIVFDKFGIEAAREWLAAHDFELNGDKSKGSLTLADLYAKLKGHNDPSHALVAGFVGN